MNCVTKIIVRGRGTFELLTCRMRYIKVNHFGIELIAFYICEIIFYQSLIINKYLINLLNNNAPSNIISK